MQEMKIKLDAFEGPLDLLLHLIHQMEIDIYEIPIAEITDQYLSYLHSMQALELEVAGEYLVMAATLMAIKSRTLLPTVEVELDESFDYEEDPRENLIQQLIEYKQFKSVATYLSEKEEERGQYFTKEPMPVDEYKEKSQVLEKELVNTVDLFFAFHHILSKSKQKDQVETTIAADEKTIDEKMTMMWDLLTASKDHSDYVFEDFLSSYEKKEIVVTFMAMLELIRNGKIKITQEENYEKIILSVR